MKAVDARVVKAENGPQRFLYKAQNQKEAVRLYECPLYDRSILLPDTSVIDEAFQINGDIGMASVDSATIHLRRAFGLLQGVDQNLEQLRSHVLNHNENLDHDGPFLASMVSGFKGARQLSVHKAALHNDLQLASAELDRSIAMNPDAIIENEDGVFNAVTLKAWVLQLGGTIEMIAGSGESAIQLFQQSLQVVELPNTHYMLGLVYEDRYNSQAAGWHFEKCLELDPDGELSVAAIRDANRMRNYKKKFRGDWGLLAISIVFCFPVAPIYFI